MLTSKEEVEPQVMKIQQEADKSSDETYRDNTTPGRQPTYNGLRTVDDARGVENIV